MRADILLLTASFGAANGAAQNTTHDSFGSAGNDHQNVSGEVADNQAVPAEQTTANNLLTGRVRSDVNTMTFMPHRVSDFDRRFDVLADIDSMPGADAGRDYAGQRSVESSGYVNTDRLAREQHAGYVDQHVLSLTESQRARQRSDTTPGVNVFREGQTEQSVDTIYDNANVNSNSRVSELRNTDSASERQRQRAAIGDYGAAIDGMNAFHNANTMMHGSVRQAHVVNPGGPAQNIDQNNEQGNQLIPMVSALRENNHINACVNRRLAELGIAEDDCEGATDINRRKQRGKKSGLSRTIEDQVIRDIDWPHLYVYRGTDRKPAQYNELTLAEFVHGYLSMIDNPRNNLSREVMLNILKDMTLDATLYGWPQIRNFYRILASSIEMARFDWNDTIQISALGLQYAQKPVVTTQSHSVPRFGANPNSVRLCIPYQKGQCVLQDGHENLVHACSYCFANTGMLFKHQEKDCRRKFFASKNGQRGEQ